MARLTPDELLRIRRELRVKALHDLTRGKMHSARLLASHDDLGPLLSAQDLMEQLMDETVEAHQVPDEQPYAW